MGAIIGIVMLIELALLGAGLIHIQRHGVVGCLYRASAIFMAAADAWKAGGERFRSSAREYMLRAVEETYR